MKNYRRHILPLILILISTTACSREMGEHKTEDTVIVQEVYFPCSHDFNQFSKDVETVEFDSGRFLFIDKKTGKYCHGLKRKKRD